MNIVSRVGARYKPVKVTDWLQIGIGFLGYVEERYSTIMVLTSLSVDAILATLNARLPEESL
jgi:hypothetical protein